MPNSNAFGLSAYPLLSRVCGSVPANARRSVGIVYPTDQASIQVAVEIARAQLALPVLVGPRQRIEAQAQSSSIDLSGIPIEETDDDCRAAARRACALAREECVDMLMKGGLHTDELMHAVLDRESGLRTKKRVSHTFAVEIPGRDALLLLSDCAVNIQPDLATKRSIIENAMLVANAVGVGNPRVAILSATESILPGIQSTMDAAALRTMAARGQIRGGRLDGPLALDNSVSVRSAQTKQLESDVAGHADVLIMPNLEAGNILYKSLVYFGGAECAGIVMGAQVPVVLTSRAESLASRVASTALGLHTLHAANPT
ncbi:bifunctional enoyl-CoA hydratase/phosphate acetyltransferase [Paraburkholderia unamae]|uniref:bifunctional enoyl-CoA hydratase/phosphate acetyltransferase n=1 Tax=Paraburkholderia unamae TaxID=219649 RepID=UPI001CC403A1|nr:bifunctional enoyl-CoA hydratase/phosphate acetyltransferase [Paraburkholderia unamae]